MGKLSDAVRRFLASVGFGFREESDRFDFGIGGKNGNFNVTVRTRELRHQIIVHARLPMNVPEEKRPAMCEFITRANWGLLIGNFEMDMQDGELRYKTSIDLEDVSEIPDAVIRHLIGFCMSTFNRYMPAVFSIIFTDTEPSVAVREIESSSGRPSEAAVGVTEEPIPSGESPVGGETPFTQSPEEAHRLKLERIRSALSKLRSQGNESPGKGEIPEK